MATVTVNRNSTGARAGAARLADEGFVHPREIPESERGGWLVDSSRPEGLLRAWQWVEIRFFPKTKSLAVRECRRQGLVVFTRQQMTRRRVAYTAGLANQKQALTGDRSHEFKAAQVREFLVSYYALAGRLEVTLKRARERAKMQDKGVSS